MDLQLLLGCIGAGLWYWLITSDFAKVTIIMSDTYWMGLIIGTIYGQPAKGFMIAATIELAYMGVVSVGGTVPSDKRLAALIAIPVSLSTGVDLGAALAIAIPFGMLGSLIQNFGYVINSFSHEVMVKHVNEKKYNLLYLDAYGIPGLIKLPLAAIPVTAILYLALVGGNAQAVLAFIPDWLNHSLVLLGEVLPAVGIISCVRVIGGRKLLPWFIVGFFMCKILPGMSTLTFAIIAACVAVIVIMNMDDDAISRANAKKEE